MTIQSHQFSFVPRNGLPRSSRFPLGGPWGSFALQINDTSGLDGDWPFIAGLPFPEGELTDVTSIKIKDSTGTQVPVQMDTAATWKDGSLRWVQAGFTANPQGTYTVEYGATVAAMDAGLTVTDNAGAITVDTGVAVYNFDADKLLPQTAYMGAVQFMDGSGDGAYLVDNQGRLGRVAGATANVTNTIVKNGHARAVLHRKGDYVTSGDVVLARAEAWFYFSAGVADVKVTHSLIFTEDTNSLWVRDYGLEWKTPSAPTEATFALGNVGATLSTMGPVTADQRETISEITNEVFMLQDDYPHFLETTSVAVVGNSTPLNLSGGNPFNTYNTTRTESATGDWADAKFGTYGLTVVMPWMAQRFPKDITIGPSGMRAALWSNRSGRELDFRTSTLIDEYWQTWAAQSEYTDSGLRALGSNAQGGARTHDLWLLPRTTTNLVEARAKEASQPALVLTDPVWLTATEALGWPVYPVDTTNFPQEETVLSDFWDAMMARYEPTGRTGFIAFGDTPQIEWYTNTWRRISGQTDYGLRRHVWSLYGRSGDRRYYDYATRSNRFLGDWSFTHENRENRFVGGIAWGQANELWDTPLYWGTHSRLHPGAGNEGHDIVNWLLEYYFTGDERSLELTRLHGQALKDRWVTTANSWTNIDHIFGVLRVMANLYAREWDNDFAVLSQNLADFIIELDNSPNGINDGQRFGALYKEDRDLLGMYLYYRDTGDERARTGFLRGVNFLYRFNRIKSPVEGQAYPSFLFAAAYHLTGDHNYLRVVHDLTERFGKQQPTAGNSTIHTQMNVTMGVPTTLGLLAEAGDIPVTAFPLVRQYADPPDSKILIRKSAGESVDIRVHLRISSALSEETLTTVSVHDPNDSPVSGLNLQSETMFNTVSDSRRDLRRRFASLTIPAQEPAGTYTVEFPGAEYVDILDTDALAVSIYAPDGHRLQWWRWPKVDYFWVPVGVETLQLSLSGEVEVRRPDGSVVGSNLTGTQNISVGAHTGAWSVVSTNSATVQLLNVEPIFSREPTYVEPFV